MASLFSGSRPMSFNEMQCFMKEHYGKTPSAIRISVGLATNFADTQCYLAFMRSLLDRTAEEVGELLPTLLYA